MEQKELEVTLEQSTKRLQNTEKVKYNQTQAIELLKRVYNNGYSLHHNQTENTVNGLPHSLYFDIEHFLKDKKEKE